MKLALPACHGPVCGRVTHKSLWLKVNRLLAWALVLSPVVQIALGAPFVRGLLFDLGLLAAHGLLSLVLFGLPRTPPRKLWLLFAGIEPDGLSPRNRFLMTGWGIALAFFYTPAFLATPLVMILLGPTWVLLWLVMPVRVVSHIHQAATYAGHRWGVRKDEARLEMASVAALVFVVAHAVNLVRWVLG